MADEPSEADELAALKRRVAELEAKEAEAAPVFTPAAAPARRKPKPSRTPWIVVGVVVAVVGTAFTWWRLEIWRSNRAGEQISREFQARVRAGTIPQPAEAAEPEGWSYDVRRDALTDKPIRTACVTSQDEVRLNPPYSPVRAQLCLRDHPQHGEDAYFALDGDGQIICHDYPYCTVQVRFDDKPPQAFSAGRPSDHSSNMIFLVNRQRLEAGLAGAAKTRVQVEYYEAGVQTVTFATEGLKWPDPPAPAKAP